MNIYFEKITNGDHIYNVATVGSFTQIEHVIMDIDIYISIYGYVLIGGQPPPPPLKTLPAWFCTVRALVENEWGSMNLHPQTSTFLWLYYLS